MSLGSIKAGQAYVEFAFTGRDKAIADMQKLSSRIEAFKNRLNGFKAGMQDMPGGGGAMPVVGEMLQNLAGGIGTKALNVLNSMYQSLVRLAQAAAFVGVAFAGWTLKESIENAMNMQETISRFNVVFGQSRYEVQNWGDELAATFGRSRKEIYDTLSVAKAFFDPQGFDQATSMGMSKAITQLSYDLASFMNIADQDAFQNLMSGLHGETEPLMKFGISLHKTALEAELLKHNIKFDEATEGQKVMARFNVIMAATSNAQGDVMRTSDSLANRLKAMKAQWVEMTTQIGTQLIPVVQILVAYLTSFLERLSLAVQSMTQTSGALNRMSADGEMLYRTLNLLFHSVHLGTAIFHSLENICLSVSLAFQLMELNAAMITNTFRLSSFSADDLNKKLVAIHQTMGMINQSRDNAFDHFKKAFDGKDQVGSFSKAIQDELERLNDLQKQRQNVMGQDNPYGAIAKIPAAKSIEDSLDRLKDVGVGAAKEIHKAMQAATIENVAATSTAAWERAKQNNDRQREQRLERSAKMLEESARIMQKAFEDSEVVIARVEDA